MRNSNNFLGKWRALSEARYTHKLKGLHSSCTEMHETLQNTNKIKMRSSEIEICNQKTKNLQESSLQTFSPEIRLFTENSESKNKHRLSSDVFLSIFKHCYTREIFIKQGIV